MKLFIFLLTGKYLKNGQILKNLAIMRISPESSGQMFPELICKITSGFPEIREENIDPEPFSSN